MEHKNRWFTGLNVMRLEDRMQPGTLLTTGIDAGAAAEVIAEPQQDRVIKRLKASEDIQIVAPLAQSEKLLSAPSAARRVEAAQTQQVGQNVVNPAITMPATQATGAGEKFNVNGREMVKNNARHELAPTPTAKRINQGASPVQAETSRTVSGAVGGSTDNGSGSRNGLPWAHYDTNAPTTLNPFGGTDRLDFATDVAVATAAPCLDYTITSGQIGRLGTVRYYAPDAIGTLARQLNTLLVSGTRATVNAIAEHPVTGEIYGVGNVTAAPINPFGAPSGTLLRTFVSKWSAPGAGCTTVGSSFPTVSTFFDTPAFVPPGTSTTLSLNDIDIQLGVPSGNEVTVVGTANDPGFVAWDVVEVIGLDDASLAVGADTLLSFGSATLGLSVVVDDGLSPGPGKSGATFDPMGTCMGGPAGLIGNRMIGAVINFTGLARPLDFTWDDSDTGVGCDWGWIWNGGGTYTASAYPDPETGFFGMAQEGDDLYAAGGIQNDNPAGFQPMLNTGFVLSTDTRTGAAVINFGWLLGATGGHYTIRDMAPDGLSDDSFVAGSINSYGVASAITEGDTTRLGFDGLPVTFQTSACTGAIDEDTIGDGIAVHPDGDVSVAGRTDAPSGDWDNVGCPDGSPAQTLTAVDNVFGGTGAQEPDPDPISGPPSDGFVFRRII